MTEAGHFEKGRWIEHKRAEPSPYFPELTQIIDHLTPIIERNIEKNLHRRAMRSQV